MLHLPNYTDRGGAIRDYMVSVKEANYTFELKCDRVTIVGYEAFRMCNNLLKVTMPCVTSVRPKAFNYCSNLETVTMDDEISINSNAFGWCMSLTTVSLPKVTLIDETAFIGCFAIAHVVCPFAALENILLHATGPVNVRFTDDGIGLKKVDGWTGAKATRINADKQTGIALVTSNRRLRFPLLPSASVSPKLPTLPDPAITLILEATLTEPYIYTRTNPIT